MQVRVDVVSAGAVLILADGRMDAKNAAKYCGISVKTMAMKRCDGTGPRYVKQGRIFYFLDDLDAWLKGGAMLSTAQRHGISHGILRSVSGQG